MKACNATASGSYLSCTTWCRKGYSKYPPGMPNPVSTCNQETGEWSPINLFCIHADPQSNCDASPTTPQPENTEGPWKCSNEGTGARKIKICTCDCAANYTSGPSGPPTATCQYGASGFWQPVKGACVAKISSGGDVELPPGYVLPANTVGWDKAQCVTAKDRSGNTATACVALCSVGYYGRPHDPTALRVGSSNTWGEVIGACVATRPNEKPCYGFPTGAMRLPIQDGSNAYWDASCGGHGFCWDGDTSRCGNISCCRGCSSNCGQDCNTYAQDSGYCMGAVTHGRVCLAVCTNGAPLVNAPRWRCEDGAWRNVNGKMCEAL